MQDVNAAVAHKDNVVDGGGERVAAALGEAIDGPVYSGYVPDGRDTDFVDLFADRPVARRAIAHGGLPRQVAYMLMWRGRADALREYDVVVTSGNEPLWYMPEEDQAVVAYCHHTLRIMHDRVAETDSAVQALHNIAKEALFAPNVRRPELFLANSDITAERLAGYLGVDRADVRVVYPPVPTGVFGDGIAPDADHYVTCSRLVSHKRIRAIVEAFRGLDARLIVLGDGPQRTALEAAAPDNVEVLGYVPEQRKRELLSSARAFCFNAVNEDFGIAPAEALASGTPVITVDEGFPPHMVEHGRTGLVFERGLLRDAIRQFEAEGVSASAGEIEAEAERYSSGAFLEGVRAAVHEAAGRKEVAP